MNVIKEYLNPNFRNKNKKIVKKTVNEKMMYEIRNFIDTAADQFKKRKTRRAKAKIFESCI